MEGPAGFLGGGRVGGVQGGVPVRVGSRTGFPGGWGPKHVIVPRHWKRISFLVVCIGGSLHIFMLSVI